MGRARDEESLQISNDIITQVSKRPCLFDPDDPNNRNRRIKSEAWDEVCSAIVPGWGTLTSDVKAAEGSKVQNRWRSIRDCYTKSFKHGAHIGADQSPPGSRKHQKYLKMSFLRIVLEKKERRAMKTANKSLEIDSKCINKESPIICDVLRNQTELDTLIAPHLPANVAYEDNISEQTDTPLNLSVKSDTVTSSTDDILVKYSSSDKILTKEKGTQTDANETNVLKFDEIDAIDPKEDIKNDRAFNDRLQPFLERMDEHTKLHCREQILKLIKYAQDGKKAVVDEPKSEVTAVRDRRLRTVDSKTQALDSGLSMTTRSADGSRPNRKRRRSPSPVVVPPPKKRGPGRPRKIRPEKVETPEHRVRSPSKKRSPRLRVSPVIPGMSPVIPEMSPVIPEMSPVIPEMSRLEMKLSKATSLLDLGTHEMMRILNLERAKTAPPVLQTTNNTSKSDQENNTHKAI